MKKGATTITLLVIVLPAMKTLNEKRKTRYEVEVAGNGKVSAHGCVLLIDQMAPPLQGRMAPLC